MNCRPPVAIDHVLPDPGLARRLAERNAPYWPVQRYFASVDEMRALSDGAAGVERTQRAGAPMMIGPVFRGDWAYDRPLVDGADIFLHNPGFIEAARAIFGGAVVRPQIVYANLSLPMLCGDSGHTDVPAFRGVDRTRHPIWLLATMGRSGLFERWRIPIATAVAWFYEGEGGGLCYWPDGPDAAPTIHPPTTNTALVGDNDHMFHRVESIGGADDEMVRGLTRDSQLVWAGDDTWRAVDAGRVLASYPSRKVRLSVSWKAQILRDEEEARVVDEHLDDLSFEQVVHDFIADLAARDVPVERPVDPLHDPSFITALRQAYRRTPSVYPWGR
jgi:hypothetical protein